MKGKAAHRRRHGAWSVEQMLVHGLAQAYQGEPHTVSHCSNKDRLSPLPRLLRAAPASQAWSTASTSIYVLHTAALPCS